MDESQIILRPILTIRASRVAEVLGVDLEKANRLLSQPDTRQILTTALEQSFQATIDATLKQMLRVPLESVPVVRDCAVKLPALPIFETGLGI